MLKYEVALDEITDYKMSVHANTEFEAAEIYAKVWMDEIEGSETHQLIVKEKGGEAYNRFLVSRKEGEYTIEEIFDRDCRADIEAILATIGKIKDQAETMLTKPNGITKSMKSGGAERAGDLLTRALRIMTSSI